MSLKYNEIKLTKKINDSLPVSITLTDTCKDKFYLFSLDEKGSVHKGMYVNNDEDLHKGLNEGFKYILSVKSKRVALLKIKG